MTTSDSKIQSIKCISCNAPLKLYGGGHRIRTLNCEYCGASMDARREYKLLAKFSEHDKPYSPLEIGMEGKINDIHFTIIGMIGYHSNYGDSWVDLFLYSPTHGYAWLTYNGGHFMFTRKVRDFPNIDLNRLQLRSSFSVRDTQFKLFERYKSRVSYVAGELTWIAKPDDTILVTDSIAPPFLFSQEVRAEETEYYLSEYLDPSVIYNNFDTKFKTTRHSIHPAQPFVAPIKEAISRVSRPFIIIAVLAIMLLFIVGRGNTVYDETIPASEYLQGAVTHDFKITNTNHLVEFKLYSPLSNAWTWYDITLFKGQNEFLSFNKQLSFYSGYEGGESWSEGSQTVNARFKIKEPGNYSLRIEASDGGTGNSGTSIQKAPLHLSIKEGVMGIRYFVILLIISFAGFLWLHISQYTFEAKRWSDGDDD
jgi:hypothetical protein